MNEAHTLFAYGTLMREEVLETVIGRRLQGERAVLSGYRRLCVKGQCYPVLVPSADDTVEGLLYRGITEREIVLLDAFEGCEYDRIGECVNGVPAQVYVLSPAWKHMADSRTWLPEMLTPEQVASFIE